MSFSAWSHYKPIAVRDQQVDADLTDVPLLVKITGDADLSRALATGHDVRFSLADGETELPYDRVCWSGGGGSPATAIFYVSTPSIAASGGASIRMYYGQTAAGDGRNPAAVWAGYLAVLHLIEAGNGSPGEFVDSTGNGHDGQGLGGIPAQVAGKIDRGQDFTRADQDGISLGDWLAGQPAMSFSCWLRPKSSSADHDIVVKGAHSTWEPLVLWRDEWASGDRYGIIITDTANHTTGAVYTSNGSAAPAGVWQHLALTFAPNSATGLRVYLDGVEDANSPFSTIAVDQIKASAGLVRLGKDSANLAPMDGVIEEVRFRNAVPANPAAWFKFHVANVAAADHELTIGPEVAVAAPPVGPPYRMAAGDLFSPGAETGRVFLAAAAAGQLFHTGVAAGEIDGRAN